MPIFQVINHANKINKHGVIYWPILAHQVLKLLQQKPQQCSAIKTVEFILNVPPIGRDNFKCLLKTQAVYYVLQHPLHYTVTSAVRIVFSHFESN